MSWRTLFLENYLPGDLCSGLIICWRKSSGEMSPGEKFLGEKCDEFSINMLHLSLDLVLKLKQCSSILHN